MFRICLIWFSRRKMDLSIYIYNTYIYIYIHIYMYIERVYIYIYIQYTICTIAHQNRSRKFTETSRLIGLFLLKPWVFHIASGDLQRPWTKRLSASPEDVEKWFWWYVSHLFNMVLQKKNGSFYIYIYTYIVEIHTWDMFRHLFNTVPNFVLWQHSNEILPLRCPNISSPWCRNWRSPRHRGVPFGNVDRGSPGNGKQIQTATRSVTFLRPECPTSSKYEQKPNAIDRMSIYTQI